MRVVSASGCPFFQRGAVSSRVLGFHLSQIGIEADSFCQRFGAVVRDSPFDPYDPALAAEEHVRDHAPHVYKEHEKDWLRCWETLHETGVGTSEAPPGPAFWRRRVSARALHTTLDEMRAYRQRCCQRYWVSPGRRQYEWQIAHRVNRGFKQQVPDARARLRRFSGFSEDIIYDDDLLRLLGVACEVVSRAPHLKPQSFEVTTHLMLTHAGIRGSRPAPEGMHQDGANYIVSALVLERRNVEGGASVINRWRKDGPSAIDSIVLAEGQGILQADIDSHLFHGVTAVVPRVLVGPSYRSILGFDISYSKGKL